ncbi:MAG TPA: hypothetical protein VFT74_13110 [Isosphaeraceae bacterium]|nr:hypothetical protein [Isosphaeraceae bacterium]
MPPEDEISFEGPGSADLTGRWVGFYRHRFENLGAFPLTADLQHEDTRLFGEMYDQITDRSEFLDSILEAYGEQISDVERRRIERLVHRFQEHRVEYISHLPEASKIEGRVLGERVDFLKTYQGAHEVRVLVDGKENRSWRWPQHKVLYAGRLDVERSCLEGRWTIRRPGFFGRLLAPMNWGSFELYRKS